MLTLSWTRLEPGIRTPDLQAGIEARTHDPLWLLGRQWQVGEFRAEDGGTPISARVVTRSRTIERYEAGGVVRPFDSAARPLEALVEEEPATWRGPDLRLRSRAGMHLQRGLERLGHGDAAKEMLKVMGFIADDVEEIPLGEDSSFLRVMIGRSLDGARVLKALHNAAPGVPPALATVPASILGQLLKEWKRRYEKRLAPATEGTAWIEDRMEYGFSLRLDTDEGELCLEAPEVHGGRLDWDAFSARTLGEATPAPADESEHVSVPTAITFAGMPDPRFWSFENRSVDLGEASAGAADVGRMLLAEFAFSWGNDWFQVPVELPTATLTTSEIEITDTFGAVTRIEPYGAQDPWTRWRMFGLSRADGAPPGEGLFIPPVLANTLQGRPVESIALVRDEGANIAWAIEETVPDCLGRGRRRSDSGSPKPAPSESGAPRHELMSPLKNHWVPLIAVRDGVDGPRFLTRAGVLEDEGDTAVATGVLLGAAEGFRIHEDELPRSGVQLERAHQVARWYDGRRVTWTTREKRHGAEAPSSGLEFDTLS